MKYSMSPSGHLKRALPNHRKANCSPNCSFFYLVYLIFILSSSQLRVAYGSSVVRDKFTYKFIKTTPTYDYYENGIESLDIPDVDVVVSSQEKIQKKIIPIMDHSADPKTVTKEPSRTLEKNKKISSDVDKVIGDKKSIGSSREMRTYCSDFESKCMCSSDGMNLTCKEAGFVEVPSNLPSTLRNIKLQSNNITELKPHSFVLVPELEELVLSHNKLSAIHPDVFKPTPKIQRLVLNGCSLTEIPAEAIKHLIHLTSLEIVNNRIRIIRPGTFVRQKHLKFLRLDANQIQETPWEALSTLTSLEALNLAYNQLTDIPGHAFQNLHNLEYLLLKRNRISTIHESAFANLTSLKVLQLDDNLLGDIPIAIHTLPALENLLVSGNKIKYIGPGILQKSPGISLLELKGNPLVGVDPHAFSFLPKLKTLILSNARDLTIFPSLNGTSSLEILKLDRAAIAAVPHTLCRTCPKLKTLDMKSNRLTKVPELSHCKDLRMLDLSSNHISSIEGSLFKSLGELLDLLAPHNLIETIPRDAFLGLTKLQMLNMEDNKIAFIHPDAFLPISNIEDLNVANNIFPHLPASGLQNLLHMKTYNNPFLREFHHPEEFPKIQTLVLSYAYHCCAFVPDFEEEDVTPPYSRIHEAVIIPGENVDINFWNENHTDIWSRHQNVTNKLESFFELYGSNFSYPENFPAYIEEFLEEEGRPAVNKINNKIKCVPLPGPFLPCHDLFDWWTLRCGVWVVFLLAMLGNGTVVFVLIFSRSKMDVPRFLVCNLAAADFFMGVYLGFLAVVDASTLGEFKMYAIPWQMSAGCQLAGFLGVLSSELSVFTLAVITLERNYAITHAMHLNKRLSLKHAGYIMLIGWTFSLSMATLPLLGISDYRKFAICLPFETTNGPASLTYVVFLMFINGVAFLILMGCYLKMYCAIRGSQAWNSNDSRIAKRMALLVFTDFLCWSPIAFFSLTAAFGLQLISLEQAKVFTVFILPLNSCCNPFLYAILTKQFKKDCVLICKAIEESRVTRGIGRCRHSSNFSNRQTPANTNSLVDRSSRDQQQLHPTPCSCSAKLLSESGGIAATNGRSGSGRGSHSSKNWFSNRFRNFFSCLQQDSNQRHRTRSDQYAYQIAEIQQKQHKRASSVSSSENFSSSRSDSWRHNHHCGIPLRLLDPKRRTSSWLVSRKTSQDSNLSSSRNDSSGSATTASTSTWRMSRSSASSEPSRSRAKPRLTRQHAIRDEYGDPPGSPGRLTVRFLTTIPSAAETSMQLDEEPPSPARPQIESSLSLQQESHYTMHPESVYGHQGEQLYAVLHAGAKAPLTTLHPARELPLDAEKSNSPDPEPT